MHSLPRSRAELRKQTCSGYSNYSGYSNCSGNASLNIDDAQVTISVHEYNRLIRLDATQPWCLHEPYCCREHRAAPYWCRFCLSKRTFPHILSECNRISSECALPCHTAPPICNTSNTCHVISPMCNLPCMPTQKCFP